MRMKLPSQAAQRECGAGIIAQNVEADGQVDCGANGSARGGHGSDGFGANICFCKRDVAEVFDKNRMTASGLVCPGIGNG
jgi:hypothetical protein